MSDPRNSLAIALFSEVLAADQMIRNRLARVLPKGMELSHFSVLNHLGRASDEKSPAQLAQTFHVTRGAMTNTLSKLEWAGYVHIRPDWDDARRKMISISPAGRLARDAALSSIAPMISGVLDELGEDKVRAALPILRELRSKLEDDR
ncbi:MarR family transcriptional regulator [Pseudooceanicola sediminis]|uniref:MarR family transcriptional regulator n=1 Tax=Pseudooceanicola sediminis TaxID=2211117 RepID=A0A399J838_9RHOB|nr:MarR family transcriptional regulator [Pseudooceanicola sediminis]KAA2315415.1 MarR family transcriptional regulator [Puniceibacterium sp. HSS470]RII40379.1 MarR family transcriptional regulator [Pseudooceanicola sediminis]|tara:strand:+ start:74515 stop:74958 length:444 start_codon:yes stop_codon:yes gene_type:complete